MKTQPLLSRIEIIGRLLSKELIDNRKFNLSVGLFQHFDFFDSDTISHYSPNDLEHCVVPYKLGAPACVGVGSVFRFQGDRIRLTATGHLNGVLLGGILSDYYRYYHRNYNWASGFSIKLGAKGYCLQDRLSFAVNYRFYRFYTKNALGSDVDWSETPGGKPVNVNGDESIGSFYHFEGQLNYKLLKSLFFTVRFDIFKRDTRYQGGKDFGILYASDWYISSNQESCQIMLTKTF